MGENFKDVVRFALLAICLLMLAVLIGLGTGI